MPGEAKAHSDQTHQIPPPPFARGERDYTKIIEQIVDMSFETGNTVIPPYFTAEHEIPIAHSILNQFKLSAGEGRVDLKIYPISELFYELKKRTAEMGGREQPFHNIHIAKSVFEKDCYDYYSGMGCDVRYPLFAVNSLF
jgi:hypothetical protein